MRVRTDIEYPVVGKKYEQWTVLEGPDGASCPSARKWLCECECGNRRWVNGYNIALKRSTECGSCMRHLVSSTWFYHRLLGIVDHAISRCTEEQNKVWEYYGGRGITVHAAWLENKRLFIEYLLTLSGHDDPTLRIDREDNDGNYEPGNLRFVTAAESTWNQRQRKCKYSVEVGDIYGEWTVMSKPSVGPSAYYECDVECSCGNRARLRVPRLVKCGGRCRSCACVKREQERRCESKP